VHELSVGLCRNVARADGRHLYLIRCEGCIISCDELNYLWPSPLGSLDQIRRQRLNEHARGQSSIGLSGASPGSPRPPGTLLP
jgi:hypothetical protein